MPKKLKMKNKGQQSRPTGQKQGIGFNKELGQHILKNPLVVSTIIEKVR